jgi:hypothetical protein
MLAAMHDAEAQTIFSGAPVPAVGGSGDEDISEAYSVWNDADTA